MFDKFKERMKFLCFFPAHFLEILKLLYKSYYILPQSNIYTMRSRSGGIHSDSTQGFLLMAELSHTKTGIFYDQVTNKKLMNQIKKTQNLKISQKKTHLQTTSSTQNTLNVFKHFNFNAQTQQEQEQSNELDKKDSNISKVIRLGILTQNINELKARVGKQANLKFDFLEQSRFIDLLVIPYEKLLLKIWLFDAHSFKEHKLATTYLSHCHALYLESGEHFALEVVQSQQIQQLVQKYFSFLV